MTDKEKNGDVAMDGMVCMINEVDFSTITGLGPPVPGKECMKFVGDDEKLTNGPPNQKINSTNMIKKRSAKKDEVSREKVLQASRKPHKKQPSKRGRRRSINSSIGSPIQDPQEDASGGKTTETNSRMASDEVPIGGVSDDQPLSKWFEGMHTPTTVDSSRVFPGWSVQQSAEANEIEKENFSVSPAVDDKGNTGQGGNGSLPFVKNTLLWQTIESMEVFERMPQKPHFHPLVDCKESSREGLAIGSMVTFCSVVERTASLRFDGPRSSIEECLETLVELESHGFDVQVVRDRLTGLLLIKDKHVHLQDQIKDVESEMVDHNVEKTKIVEEIGEIEKQIEELQEKRARAISMKEVKDSEIATLQSRSDELNEGIRKAQGEFEGSASAPW
ncbi:unnamed protein product [Ilex paraguariensis]|uniref:Uncharacterized protein n=1 Tax=Ilex paraguariensis TaxID=185542 RepID=A0ABC8RRF4_9AQUA